MSIGGIYGFNVCSGSCWWSARFSFTIYILSQLAAQTLGTTFPYGTWVVNAVGSLCIGFLAVGLTRCAKNPVVAALLITGFLGDLPHFLHL